MNRGLLLRFLTVVAVTALSWLVLWPSIDQRQLPAPRWVRDTFTHRISPGLDMRGGLRLMYQVDLEEYVRDLRDRKSEEILRRSGVLLGILDEDEAENPPAEKLERLRARITVRRSTTDGGSMTLTFAQPRDADRITREWVRENFPDFVRQIVGGGVVRLSFRDSALEQLRNAAVAQAANTISERIDSLGVREASVSHREDDIIVEVPGANEATFAQMREVVAKTAHLEFLVLDDGVDWLPADATLPEGVSRGTESVSAGTARPNVPNTYLSATGPAGREALEAFIGTLTVADDHILRVGEIRMNSTTGTDDDDKIWRTYYAFKSTDVTGEDIDDARTDFDQSRTNEPYVLVRFKPDGADEFSEMTGRNVKRRMAIVLDDVVMSAPVIQARIGAQCSITLGGGSFQDMQAEANDLVIVLRSGALPASLRPTTEQMIGPTLGRDAVARATTGAVVGVGVVLVFMIVYYQYAGLIAALMVLVNIILQLALMAFFEATLTLPGIAATALTVGMAVDANVLITERIRDELRAGRSARSAVDQGFDRAFWSIFDSQITTFIAGVVLFQFGTGPIKGFSVMLMIGIFTSLFTGIFGSRVFMDFAVRVLKWERIPVG